MFDPNLADEVEALSDGGEMDDEEFERRGACAASRPHC